MYRVLMVHATSLAGRGGAEHSLAHHLRHAPAHVQVDVVAPDDARSLHSYHAIILANLRPPGGAGERNEAIWAVKWAARLADYRGRAIKSERDFHPCAHRDGRCLSGYPVRRRPCDCSRLIGDAYANLYNQCAAVQFLSPAHQQGINLLVAINCKQYVIAAPIDDAVFRSITPWEHRQHVALVTGDDLRVSDDAQALARKHGYPLVSLPYLSAAFEDMPAIYNQYQAIIVAPRMFHAFGRVAVEALACGCKVFTTSRVGAMSWPDPLHAARQANACFWDMVLNHQHA